jgi:hypothetical protein
VDDVVTSVGIWDESIDAKERVVLQSLDGLGGVPAAIWSDYLATVTGNATQPLPATLPRR